MSDSIAQHAVPEEGQEKIFFYLPTDEHGYPPYSYESLWAEKVRDDTYRIENIPFFVRELCAEDVVTTLAEDGTLYFQEVLEYSRRNTVRVVLFEEKRGATLVSELRSLDLGFEGLDNYLFAIDIDDPEKMASLVHFLSDGNAKGWWEYEESALRL